MAEGGQKRDPVTHRTPGQQKRQYKNYWGKPEEIARRSERNKARRMMEERHGKAALKGKDVHHIKQLAEGGSNKPSNMKIESTRKHRSRPMHDR